MKKSTALDFAFIRFYSERSDLKRCEGSSNSEWPTLPGGTSEGMRFDPSKVLRILVRNDILSKIDDEGDGYDYGNLRTHAKGVLKGGKMNQRDKRFGYKPDFWDWWHRHGKKKNGGQDIKTKAEAEKQYKIYQSLLLEIRSSVLMQSVRRLSFTDQSKARKLLYLFWFVHSSHAV